MYHVRWYFGGSRCFLCKRLGYPDSCAGGGVILPGTFLHCQCSKAKRLVGTSPVCSIALSTRQTPGTWHHGITGSQHNSAGSPKHRIVPQEGRVSPSSQGLIMSICSSLGKSSSVRMSQIISNRPTKRFHPEIWECALIESQFAMGRANDHLL